jgi:hypothetical protein
MIVKAKITLEPDNLQSLAKVPHDQFFSPVRLNAVCPWQDCIAGAGKTRWAMTPLSESFMIPTRCVD